MSVHQLAIYHSVLLYWKVRLSGEPNRLVRLVNISASSEARINLTERIWSRKVEYNYRQIEPLCGNVVKVSGFKKILCEWVKSHIPIYEE